MIKKILYKTAVIVLLLMGIQYNSFSQQSGGFVSLKGKQFFLNGEKWYPLIMNYNVCLIKSGGNYYVGPHPDYYKKDDSFHLNYPKYTSQEQYSNLIKADLQKIQDIGFNSIRLFGLAYGETGFDPSWAGLDDTDPTKIKFSEKPATKFLDLDATTDYPWSLVEIIQQDPAPAGKISWSGYINSLETILDIIEDNDINLKMMYLVGYFIINHEHTSPQNTKQQFLDFSAYCANRFKDNPVLWSYDILNEPYYTMIYDGNNEQEYKDANNESVYINGIKLVWSNIVYNYNKQTVCEFVKACTNAIRSGTYNQQVTIGSDPSGTVWDPAVYNVDFVQYHIYPYPIFENDPNHQQKAINRTKSYLYWIGKVCKTPWIVGETGISVNSDPSDVNDNGTIADFEQYLNQILTYSRDCGSSGFGWWEFGDVNYGYYLGFVKMDENNNGIVQEGTYKSSTMNSYIQNFNPYNVTPVTTPPDIYYNIYDVQEYTTSGTVKYKDENNNLIPIENACITGWNENWGIAHCTYSRPDGTFTLFSSVPIAFLRCTAYGAGQQDDPLNNNFELKFLDMMNTEEYQDRFVNNQTINIGGSEIYEAWNSVTIQNTLIDGNGTSGGQCQIKSNGEIMLKTGFHAKNGSYVHANIQYLSVSDCDIIDDQIFQLTPPLNDKSIYSQALSKYGSENQKSITDAEKINKSVNVSDFIIKTYPNPCFGKLNISIQNPDKTENIICIYNSEGELINEIQTVKDKIEINMFFYPQGIYLVNVISGKKFFSEKIIHNN